MQDHQKDLEAIKQITVDQIGVFDKIASIIHEQSNTMPEVFGEVWQRHMCDKLGLNYDLWVYYNELSNYMVLGMPPYMPVLQIACNAFIGAGVQETLTRFAHIDKELAINAYEVGNEWLLDNHRLVCTCRAVDALVCLYDIGKLELDEQDDTRCIAYPGMPNLPHHFVEMYRLIDEARLVIEGRWRTPLIHYRSKERDYLWNYPPDLSALHNAIIRTASGTIYLTGAPKRGDTNSNHLRSV